MYCWASAALIATFLWALYIWRKKKFSLFKELGIPGPEPSLIFGNLLEVRRRGAAMLFEEWIKKYGKIVGFYNGVRPFLLIYDMEILKKVQTEDFHNFSARGVLFGVSYVPEYEKHMLTATAGSRWKDMRTLLSPAFSPNKLAQMAIPVSMCTDTLINVLKKKSAGGHCVEVTMPIRLAFVDIMLKAGFSADLNVQQSPAGGSMEDIATGITTLLQTVPLHGVPFLANCFPELHSLWALLVRLEGRLFIPYIKLVLRLLQPVVETRRSHPSPTTTDILQLLLNSEAKEEVSGNHYPAQGMRSKMSLTNEEVWANAALYFVGGLEAGPTLLFTTLYLLGLHAEVQDKVRSEVLEVLKKEGEFTYKSTMKMAYLDMVLNETMRIYTSNVGFVNRLALQDYEVDGLKIPKGVSVMVPVSYMHSDPNRWHEPDRFDPERFRPENISLIDKASFQPFGHGPRQCIGRNFALMQVRLMVSKFISAFGISVDKEHHKEFIKMKAGLVGASIPNNLWLKLEDITI